MRYVRDLTTGYDNQQPDCKAVSSSVSITLEIYVIFTSHLM